MWNNPVEQNLFLRSKEDHYDHYTAVHCLATAHGTTKVHLENFAEHDNAQLCTAVHTGNTRSKTIPDMAFFSRPCPCTCNTSLVSFISKNLQKEKGRCFEKQTFCTKALTIIVAFKINTCHITSPSVQGPRDDPNAERRYSKRSSRTWKALFKCIW